VIPLDADVWRSHHLARWAGALVVLLAGLLYLLTLDTGLRPDELVGGDLITHQYAQVQGRPGNAPGYPLYTLGGWLWFRLTGVLFGWAANPIQRLAGYSTLWALLALFVLYLLCLRLTRGRWPLATLVTLFYAVTYFFWYYSVTTEQYTSAVLQTLLIVWLALRWDDQTAQESPDADRTLLWLALVCGTCLANMLTVLFVLPPLIWFVLSRKTGLLHRPALLVRLAGLMLLPLVAYGFVFWRGATHPEWRGVGDWPSVGAWFLDFLTAQQGRDELSPGLTLNQFFTAEFPALIWGELTVIGLASGLIGLRWLGRRQAALLGGTLGIYVTFCWAYRFGNWYQVIMPAYALLMLGLAASANRAYEVLGTGWEKGSVADGENSSPPRPQLGRWIVAVGLVVLVSYRFAQSLPRADQSWRLEDTGLDPGWAVLADTPPAGAVVVADYDEWLALTYLREVWGASPSLVVLPLCRIQPADATYITRRAVAADPTCLADGHRYAAGAELIRVQYEPEMQLPSSAMPIELPLGDTLRLIGQSAAVVQSPILGATGRPAAPSRWRLSLYWQTVERLSVAYTVSVRPLRAGQPIAGVNGRALIQDHQPAWNAYPTTRWQPGEVVRDDYVFDLPPGTLPDGAHVVVYRTMADEQGGTAFETLGETLLGGFE
jgi:hypothetical protein